MISERAGHASEKAAADFSERIFGARHRLRDKDYLLLNTLASHAYKCSKFDLKGTLRGTDGAICLTEREFRAIRRQVFSLVSEMDLKLKELL